VSAGRCARRYIVHADRGRPFGRRGRNNSAYRPNRSSVEWAGTPLSARNAFDGVPEAGRWSSTGASAGRGESRASVAHLEEPHLGIVDEVFPAGSRIHPLRDGFHVTLRAVSDGRQARRPRRRSARSARSATRPLCSCTAAPFDGEEHHVGQVSRRVEGGTLMPLGPPA
jgi:hypothetical protein